MATVIMIVTLKVFALIQDRDKTISDAFDDPRRSNALILLANIKHEGLLTAAEFAQFSPEARQAVEVIENFRRGQHIVTACFVAQPLDHSAEQIVWTRGSIACFLTDFVGLWWRSSASTRPLDRLRR